MTPRDEPLDLGQKDELDFPADWEILSRGWVGSRSAAAPEPLPIRGKPRLR